MHYWRGLKWQVVQRCNSYWAVVLSLVFSFSFSNRDNRGKGYASRRCRKLGTLQGFWVTKEWAQLGPLVLAWHWNRWNVQMHSSCREADAVIGRQQKVAEKNTWKLTLCVQFLWAVFKQLIFSHFYWHHEKVISVWNRPIQALPVLKSSYDSKWKISCP